MTKNYNNTIRKKHLPSDEKGKWTGEKGNSYFIPNDEYLREECMNYKSTFVDEKGNEVPGIRYTNGYIDLSPFATTLRDKQLIGIIDFPTKHRTASPVGKEYDKVERLSSEDITSSDDDKIKNIEINGDGTIHEEFDITHNNQKSYYIRTEKDILGSYHPSYEKNKIRTMSDGSNYDQCITNISYDLGAHQFDLKELMAFANNKKDYDESDLNEICMRLRTTPEDVEKFVSRKQTVHETWDENGNAIGIIMPHDIHCKLSHSGLICEMDSHFQNNEANVSFNNTDELKNYLEQYEKPKEEQSISIDEFKKNMGELHYNKQKKQNRIYRIR